MSRQVVSDLSFLFFVADLVLFSFKGFVFLVLTLLGIFSCCCFISVWFIHGVKEVRMIINRAVGKSSTFFHFLQRNPKKIKPFLILTGIGTAAALLQGIMSLSFFWVVVGMIEVYFVIVVYSIFELVEFEGEQRECHQSATSDGYEHCHEPDLEKRNFGYQASTFEEP